MRTEFEHGIIGDYFDLINGFAFPSAEFARAGIPVIKIKNVKAAKLVLEDLSYVSTRYLSERKDKQVKPGDLLITMSGNRIDGTPETWVGKVAQFRETKPFLVNQRVGILRAKNARIVQPRFFEYALSTEEFQRQFIAIATSSGGQANLSPSQILSMKVQVPHVNVQQHIAEAAGLLDDQIEQNRRTSRALEELARAIFRAWFVDFEPVKAKAAGSKSFPSMPQNIFNSLPTRLVDSELGPIPEGWTADALSTACSLVSGGTPKRSESDYWGNDVPWYSVQDAPAEGEVWVFHTKEAITNQGLENSSATLVPKGCTIISARGTVGKLAMTGRPMTFNQSCYGLMPADENSFCYLYLLVQSVVAQLKQQTHGSVFDTITRATFDGLRIVQPDQPIVSAFEAVVSPLFDLLLASLLESRKLAGLRDYLLPKLLSGTIRVKPDSP